jgi:Fic family protein
VTAGLRKEGGFVGEHDRVTRAPLPDHVSARPDDLPELVEGLIDYATRSLDLGIDPVVTAAVVAFGFVYIHPFEDGNGRLHRWLVHYVLARAGYNPEGLVFPVSAAILRHVSEYERVLRSYSAPLLEQVEWEGTEKGNVRVLNETARFYRYFDATAHAEFLYDRVEETIERDLPREVAYLEGFDRFAERVQRLLGDMPRSTIDLLHRFLRQGEGRLSKRAREKEFAMLTDDEARAVEELWSECHEGGG